MTILPRLNTTTAACLGALALALAASLPAQASIALDLLWTHYAAGEGRAEIVAYHRPSEQLLVVNGAESCVTRLDARTGQQLGRLDVSLFGSPTSVAVEGPWVAVAVLAPRKTDPGAVLFFPAPQRSARAQSARAAATDGVDGTAGVEPVAIVRVGALPDMVTFTPDGRYLLCANEGEPNDEYTIDPEGSISVVDVARLRSEPSSTVARTADFLRFNSQRDELVRRGVRLVAPNSVSPDGRASVAQDLEPEYIAVSADSRRAWVTLQENNAIAVIDVAGARVVDIFGLGVKDHSLSANPLDASDRDGAWQTPATIGNTGASGGGEDVIDGNDEGDRAPVGDVKSRIQIRRWPVLGLYQPDGIAAYETGALTYLIGASEGEGRAYPGFNDRARVSELPLDESLLRNHPRLQDEDRLGRLHVSRLEGRNLAGKFERLYSFGGRSLTIWTDEGELVYDSGGSIEETIARRWSQRHNINGDDPSLVDSRSPEKGPEPEGVVVGRVGDAVYAFVGLERASAVAIFDVTRPRDTRLVDIVQLGPGNIAPEGLAFIPANESWAGEPLLAVACEVSGSTLLFRIHTAAVE